MTASAAPPVAGPPGFADVELRGCGATSRVYRAVDGASGRSVALKRLHRQMVRSAEALARLRRELDALRRLRHPGIVAVRDLVVWDGDPTIVMDFVEGEDLKERVTREGGLPAAEVERIGRALLDVLAMTHGSGIVHRDVKPQNVRLGADGGVYLLDFGSARLDASSQLTATGTTVGTPEYMAPELFAGSVYDPRVDLYGVGATLYECLTGQPPQMADSLAELATLRTTRDVAAVKAVAPATPAGLARVVDRCLARAPEDRYASAALATWALDNPGAEQAFSVRRSAQPPCLHCATPLPPEAAVCARCGSDHPFGYAPGACHVLLRSVADPARLIEHVVDRFPERGTVDGLHALAERCAALASGPQRYLSFVAPRGADAVVRELATAGVRAEIVGEPRLAPAFGVAFALLSLPTLFGGGFGAWWALAVGVFAIDRGTSLLAAGGGVLSTSRLPRLWAPAVVRMLALCALVITVAAAGPLGKDLAAAAAGAPLAAAWLAVAVAAWFHFPRGLVSASRAVEPGALEQLRQSFVGPRGAAPRPSEEVRPVAQAGGGALALGLFVLFIAEGFVLSQLIGREVGRAPRPPAPGVPAMAQPKAAVPVASSAASAAAATPGASGLGRRRWSPTAGDVVPLAVPIAVGVWLARRRGKARRDGAALFSEMDLAAFQQRLSRRPPRGRRPGQAGGADALARFRSEDGFQAEAVRRAAELARLLPGEAVAQLAAALESMARKLPAGREASRSLVARCILETDPEQKARFDFLALEGRLEAEAAAAWARRLGADA